MSDYMTDYMADYMQIIQYDKLHANNSVLDARTQQPP